MAAGGGVVGVSTTGSSFMNWIRIIAMGVYGVSLAALMVYGLHRYLMLYLFYRHRNRCLPPKGRLDPLPVVTVQLPVYNELYVVDRLLDAIAGLDYPRDRLEIQVLDDSTDETVDMIARKVAQQQAQGLDIHHIRRADRRGYKAGALAHGLEQARGEFVAIFDADFVPGPDLLHRTIHYFKDPGVGMIQTRWGHINEHYNLLTRLQSMFLDGHLLIEQTARFASGRFFNFNGTAGIWRRSCIVDAGGWHHDTLTEDLDLSYRAQLKGWRFIFLPEVVTPAELPVDVNAFKSQQHRWAKGSVQTCKKVLPSVWRSALPWKVKIEATVHLSSNIAYLFLAALCASIFPATMMGARADLVRTLLFDIPAFVAASLSISAFYVCAQRELHHGTWGLRALYVPLLMSVGIGLCVNNSSAVLEALFNRQSEFTRTPKYGIRLGSDRWLGKKYSSLGGFCTLLELVFGAYFTFIVLYAVERQMWAPLPFLFIFQFGFLYMGMMSVVSLARQRFETRRAHAAMAAAGA